MTINMQPKDVNTSNNGGHFSDSVAVENLEKRQGIANSNGVDAFFKDYADKFSKAGNVVFADAEIFIDGKFIKGNLLLKDNKSYLCDNPPHDAKIIDCSGLHIMPGFADIHVHLREPGFEHKETIATGTAAGLAGGFTLLCCMPNLKPVPDSAINIKKLTDIIEKTALCNVLPYGAITKGQQGEEMADLAAIAPFCIGFSDDGKGVQSEEMMLSSLNTAKSLQRPLVAHCEVGNPGDTGVIHEGEFAKKNNIPGISSESEYLMVERDIRLAKKTGAALHLCHISTAESVELIRKGKADGVKVTAETAPHYLLMTDMDIKDEGRFKMNPPIRSAVDRDALIKGICDGTIDAIATDHAPHSEEEKSKGLRGSAFGIVGLETSFATLYTGLVKTGIISLTKLVEIMSIQPRKVFNIDFGIHDGALADFCIVNLNKSYIIKPNSFKSKGRATPFDGWEVYGKVLYTHCKDMVKQGDL